MSNPYQKASQTYQKNNDENMTPLQIVVELYKGLIKNTKKAKAEWAEGHLDLMLAHLTKNFDIIEVLQSNIDMEKGGEDAVFLNRFYSVIFSAMTTAMAKPDPAAEFDAIISYIQQVYERWYALAYPPKSAEPVVTPPTPQEEILVTGRLDAVE